MNQAHGHKSLRHGRWSTSQAEYFLTCGTEDRQPVLTSTSIAPAIIDTAQQVTAEGIWDLLTMTVMPDHVHLLVRLGAHSDLAAAMRLLKGRAAPILRAVGVRWQRAYFDHRMRPDEDCLPVFRYIYLNPYRAGLLKPHEKWPSYYCAPEDWRWLKELTDDECPFPEWLL